MQREEKDTEFKNETKIKLIAAFFAERALF
jgi:hypothetical protein